MDSGRAVFAVEAGGTSTKVAVRRAGRSEVRRFGPVNPASAPAGSVADSWKAALSWIADVAGADSVGWIASASVADSSPAAGLAAVADAIGRAGLAGPVAVSSDVTPLLLGPPHHGSGFVVVAGTGSTCLAGAPDGRAVRIGGHEYVLSDEGSGYQIGLTGLRAALRATEGTAPATALAEQRDDLAGYARYLAASPRAKVEIAAFAPDVFRCHARGDQVAAAIVAGAAGDLVSLVAAAARRLGCPVGSALLCGSLFAADAPMAALVGTELRTRWPGSDVRVVPDALGQCLALAASWPHWPVSAEPPLLVFVLGPDGPRAPGITSRARP